MAVVIIPPVSKELRRKNPAFGLLKVLVITKYPKRARSKRPVAKRLSDLLPAKILDKMSASPKRSIGTSRGVLLIRTRPLITVFTPHATSEKRTTNPTTSSLGNKNPSVVYMV